MRKWMFLFFSLAILAGCARPPAGITPTPASISPERFPWWNDSVFYEIFVRSFYDSNGDGIGDFNGITEKLDYLNDGDPDTTSDLGITGIWLMPICPSPSYHGYDVTDYYAVNPEYGTMQDFRRLLSEADRRGIRIIIDLVLNHTSDQHPWFRSAVSDRNSPQRDWYIWSDKEPGYGGPWGQTVWHSSPTGYYYGLFVDFMPDLNYDNPAVTAEAEKITAFWLKDIGVDGFRLDAAKHLIEEGMTQENTPATHEWFEGYRPVYKGLDPEALAVGEVAGADQVVMAEYTQGDELDLTFDFGQASAILQAAKSGNAPDFAGPMKLTYKLVPNLQYATFIANHDQNRVLNELGGDIDKAKIAASLLLTAPGVPFLYYGEEIGLEGQKPDEDIRRPMQWSADEFAGFSTHLPWRAPGSNYTTLNVAAELDDPQSLLSHYRGLIHLRNGHAALRTGDLAILSTDNPSIFASLRVSEDEAVIVLLNLDDQPVTDYRLSVEVSSLNAGAYQALPLMGAGAFADLPISDKGAFKGYTPLAEIPAYATIIVELRPK